MNLARSSAPLMLILVAAFWLAASSTAVAARARARVYVVTGFCTDSDQIEPREPTQGCLPAGTPSWFWEATRYQHYGHVNTTASGVMLECRELSPGETAPVDIRLVPRQACSMDPTVRKGEQSPAQSRARPVNSSGFPASFGSHT